MKDRAATHGRLASSAARPSAHRAAAALLLALLAGCHPADPPLETAAAKSDSATGSGASDGVSLTPRQIQQMGLATQTAQVIDYVEQVEGYGIVGAHESIAAAVAEITAAQATSRQSEAALARTRRLAGTPGALSADAAESNERQATVDAAALTLSKQRLSTTLGQNPPWKNGGHILKALSDGSVKLVRVTFPLGALSGETPRTLRAVPIGGGTSRSWTIKSVWPAPADAAVPGRSFFGLLDAADAGEGERLSVKAPVGAAGPAVLVPSTAAVISDGKYWCYVERQPGRFSRVEFDAGRPLDAGYAVTTNIAAGDKIVTSGAGLLLAQESNSGSAE